MKSTKNNRLKKAALVDGNIIKILIKMTLPMLVGIAGMMMFNLVDTFFIGKLGIKELAAISFTFPVIFIIQSIALGLGIGTSVVIAKSIGKGNWEQVRFLTTDSLLLSFIVVMLFVAAGYFTIIPVFRLLGAKNEILALVSSYMKIWYFGVPFVIIPMVGNNAIRATGDTKTPSIIMLISISVNVVLDPLLIFGIGPFPRLGLSGAALATVFARATSFSAALFVLKKYDMLSLKLPSLADIIASWRKILYIGVPASANNLILPISIGIITRLFAQYGANAVAAFGVSSRVEVFSLAIIMALSAVFTPFVAQNLGAKKVHRIREGINYSFIFSMIWGAIIFITFIFAAAPIASLFNKNPEVIRLITLYLKIVSISYGLRGIVLISAATFNALNKPYSAFSLTFIRMFVLYVPLALLGSHLFKIEGIFFGAAAANILAGFVALLWLKTKIKHFT